jgi:HK97 family phage prohead protease
LTKRTNLKSTQQTSNKIEKDQSFAVGELFLKAYEGIGEERMASFVASTESIDADGDIVEQNWRLDRFRNNPVILFGHDSKSLPIGKATQVDVVEGRLEVTVQFASKEANPMAEHVYRSVQEGTLKAVSVGFRPHDVRQERRDQKMVYVLSDNELFEISVVPIPNNADALRKHKSFLAGTSERIELKAPYDGINFKPPKAVVSELKKGLAWHEEGHSGDGLKSETVSWARRMAGGDPISPDKVKKMRAWLARHESDKSGEGFKPGDDGFPSPGRVAWALWGGDAAKGWSNKLVEQMESADQDKEVVPEHTPKPVDTGSWDSSEAKKRLEGWSMKDGEMDYKRYEMGFAYFDAEKADTLGAYKLPHHDVVDGELVTVRAGLIAAGNAVMGSRGGVNIPESEMEGVKEHLARHYKQFDLTPPWERKENSVNGGEENKNMDLEEIKKSLDGERNKVAVLDQRCKDLEEERNIWKGKAGDYYKQIVDDRLTALVGKKITPKEKETLIKLANADEVLFEEHMKAVSDREDMPLLKEKILGDDPSPQAALPAPAGDSGAQFDKLIMQRAFGG